MAYYNICPTCQANLDPGEPCDYCADREEEKIRKLKQMEQNICPGMDGQFMFQFAVAST